MMVEGIWEVVKVRHSPACFCPGQVGVEPCQHSCGCETIIQKVRIQGYEMHSAPIEGVVTASIGYGNRIAGDRVDGQICRGILNFVIMIARSRKKRHGCH